MEGRGADSSGSGWVPVEGSHKYGNELKVFHIFRELDTYRGLCRPLGLQEVEAPKIPRCRNKKVTMLPALCIGRLYPQETTLVPISLRGSVEPRTIVRPEGLSQ